MTNTKLATEEKKLAKAEKAFKIFDTTMKVMIISLTTAFVIFTTYICLTENLIQYI